MSPVPLEDPIIDLFGEWQVEDYISPPAKDVSYTFLLEVRFFSLWPIVLTCYLVFFIYLKLELLTVFPARYDQKCYFFTNLIPPLILNFHPLEVVSRYHTTHHFK